MNVIESQFEYIRALYLTVEGYVPRDDGNNWGYYELRTNLIESLDKVFRDVERSDVYKDNSEAITLLNKWKEITVDELEVIHHDELEDFVYSDCFKSTS